MRKYTTRDESGGTIRVLEYDDPRIQADSIMVRFPPAEDNRFVVRRVVDGETVGEQAFETRELRFDPVSPLGRGASTNLLGVSETQTDIETETGTETKTETGTDTHTREPADEGQTTLDEDTTVSNYGDVADGSNSGLDVPPDVVTAMHSLGFTVVPSGRWWLDG